MQVKVYWYVIVDHSDIRRCAVVDDPSSTVQFSGYDINRKLQYFEGEGYHAENWANTHGFKRDSGVMVITLPTELKGC